MNSRKHEYQRVPGGHGSGLARALSKLGFCSRSQAWELIEAGRVRVNGAVMRDPEMRVAWQRDRIQVDEQAIREERKVYLMLNKPRGLVTTTADEQGRDTVFQCLAGKGLPFVAPVGRLDKASEGLLLFTNDTAWAARVTAPEGHLDKTYHVQVDCVADEKLAQRIQAGIEAEGEFLAAKNVHLLREGTRNSWLEIVLDEGRNRHIRRLLAALGVGVLRLVRVAIGPLPLGNLAKGEFRRLTHGEVIGLVSVKHAE
jgi:23S rRNA pseudouridine2605 synthase